MGEAAGKGAPHSNRRVGDVAADAGYQKTQRPHAGRGFKLDVTGKGTDSQLPVCTCYVIRVFDRIEIDQHAWPREAEIHCRHQCLSAGQYLCVIAVLR